MRRWFAATSGALLATGCLLTTSLDGLSSGGASPDAGRDATEAGATSDASDGSSGDGQAKDGGAGFCVGKTVTFCEDFDQEPLDRRWVQQVTPPCTLERRSNASATSNPNALVTRCSAAPSGARASVLNLGLGALTKSIAVSCMLRVDEMLSDQYSNGTTIWISGGGKEFYAQLGYEAAGATAVRLVVEKSGGDTGTAVLGTIPKGEWRRVELRVDAPGSGAGRVTLTEGASTASVDLVSSLFPPAGSRTATVSLGVYYTNTPGTTIAYDDCTVDMK